MRVDLDALPLRRLVLELTEQEAIPDFPALRDARQPLRAQRLRLAIGDTGAGYAGLRHLLALRPNIITLDLVWVTELRTFTAPLATPLVNLPVKATRRSAATLTRLLSLAGSARADALPVMREGRQQCSTDLLGRPARTLGTSPAASARAW